MYLSGNPKFKHCILFSTKVRGENYIQIQMSLQLGKKRFSFGKENEANYQKAIKAGIAIDEYCNNCLGGNISIDETYLKKLVKSINKPHLTVVKETELKTIWQEYLRFHIALNCWSESYINTHIATITNFINRKDFPNTLDKPSKILEYFLNGKRSVKTARDRFKLIVGAIDWASKNDKLDRQLGIKWRDCLSSINSKLKSDKKERDRDRSHNDKDYIDPFSIEDIEKILYALEHETHSRYKGRHYQYYHYVKFLWLTGCRPSEAIALKWDNVNLAKKKLKFCESEVMASGKLCKRKGTKTEPFRFFPVNQDLEQLLTQLPHSNDYVFLGFNGNPITQHSLNRVWQRLLPQLKIRYRIPYQLRHSMISHHANRGFPLPQLAKIVGNSEKIIREHYLKIDFSTINVPTIDS